MDASSELVHSLLPALFVSLGIGMATVGFIEGVAEATASITKIFSGALSDWLGKRKILAVIGYGLAAITKPLFPLAQSAEVLFLARFIDRIGKGIRGAPRDALIADITPPEIRGAAYGLRQSLDAAGAFIGPLLAIALMALLSDNIGLVLWFALIPAVLCMAFLVFGVHEPDAIPAGKDKDHKPGLSLRMTDLARMGGSFWFVTVIGALFALARFSVAFLALRAMDLGLPIGLSPFVLVLMSVVFSLSSYPVGLLADRIERRYLLALGFADGASLERSTRWRSQVNRFQPTGGAGASCIHPGEKQGFFRESVQVWCVASLVAEYTEITGAKAFHHNQHDIQVLLLAGIINGAANLKQLIAGKCAVSLCNFLFQQVRCLSGS
jgi:MFS family permease